MGTDEADSWYNAGNAKMMEGRSEDAINDYDKALELNPNYVSAWNNKGIAMFRLKKYEEAINCYDKILETDSNHANAWLNKANALRGLAQQYLDKANDDRTKAAKMINKSLALFDSANECYDKGFTLSKKKT